MIGASRPSLSRRARAASTPGIAPAASRVRVSTSSRSIVPASSPSIRFRRPSSCARSSASDSSPTIASMRVFMSVTRSASRGSELCAPAVALRTSQRTARSNTTAAAPAAMATTVLVVTPSNSNLTPSPQLFPVPRRLRSRSGLDLTVRGARPLDYSFEPIKTKVRDPAARGPISPSDAGFSRLRVPNRFATMPVRLAGVHPLASLCCVVSPFPWSSLNRNADCESTRAQGSCHAEAEGEDPCPSRRAAEARCLYTRVYDDPEEAEFGAAQGRPRAADERDGGRRLHPGRGAQPPGALGRPDPRRPRPRPAGIPVQGDSRRPRRGRRRRPAQGPFQVRRQERFVMPRRAEIPVRELTPDPVHNSRLVSQVINRVMTRGKKSVAEKIVYDALDRVGEQTGKPPVEVLEQAIKTITPVLEVRSRRVGGANYQVPVEVPQRRARTLAVRWLVTYSRDRREKHMEEKLAGEILDALNQQGGAFKRKDDLYRMAQANKAFAHYRW